MMKRLFSILMLAGILLSVFSCQRKERQVPLKIGVQLQFEGASFDVEGIAVTLSDAGGTVDYQSVTNASGYAVFEVPAGTYAKELDSDDTAFGGFGRLATDTRHDATDGLLRLYLPSRCALVLRLEKKKM